METMLKTQDDPNPSGTENFGQSFGDLTSLGMADPADLSNMSHPDIMHMEAFANAGQSLPLPNNQNRPSESETMGFDMISLGLEEPLPKSDVTEELYVPCVVLEITSVNPLFADIRSTLQKSMLVFQ